MVLAVERGLGQARSKKDSGYFSLGVDASISGFETAHLMGSAKYSQNITNTPLGEFSAFANAFGGMRMNHGQWSPELGVNGGFELSW